MDSKLPDQSELSDLSISVIGKADIATTFSRTNQKYVNDNEQVLVYSMREDLEAYRHSELTPPMFEVAGAREKIFFDPSELKCGIVTCGGLCPGLNDVIRSIVLTLSWQYGVKKVLGFYYGYEGISSQAKKAPMELTPDSVDDIHYDAGTILGSSRGPQEPSDMIATLVKHGIGILFVIGGDGTFAGGHAIAQEIKKQGLAISVIGIPKTIDNDIYCCDRTFGFTTAVEEAGRSIYAAHAEAKAAWNGVGLVKLMGRDSGFITAYASLANSDVNFCLVPEMPFELEGECGFLARLEKRLERKHHAVIVVAEGAGGNLVKATEKADASGNVKYQDIGLFLKEHIQNYFKSKSKPLTIKYIDPSYNIRSCRANSFDSAFCLLLGQNAVHAGMAGKTDMFVAYWNKQFTHVPFTAAIGKRKKLDPDGEIWQMLLATTKQLVV